MPFEILMPKLGLTMKTGTVVSWLKSEGDDVIEKEPVLQIETEKLSYDVESPAKGVVLKIIGAVGEKYPVRAILGYIGHPGESLPEAYTAAINTGNIDNALANSESRITNHEFSGSEFRIPNSEFSSSESRIPNPRFSSTEFPTGRIFISPVAKKLAAEKGIDYKQIKGTGPNGRIVKADVLNYTITGTSTSAAPIYSEFRIPNSEFSSSEFSSSEFSSSEFSRGSTIPYKGLRRGVGEVMQKAWTTIPMVTHQVSADAGALLEYREMLNMGITEKGDRVTIGELLLKLTAAALSMTPIMNSSLTDDGIVIHKGIHIGMATALDEGLVVPVIRDADHKGVLTISREAKELAARARSGTLYPDDFSGATFTVSNLGSFGSVDYFTPIINPPQAAILGVGRVVDTAVPIDGDIKIRPMIGLSLTYDHRVIDGATAARFIKVLMTLMASPARAVLIS